MIAPTLLAAALSTATPQLSAVRVEHPPVLDGVLDDDAWKTAPGSEAFTQKFPSEGKPPTHRTRVRVAYDDHAVYVALECEQATTPIVARLTRRDRATETDSVTITFDTRGDGKSALEFSVSAAGVLVDGLRFNDTEQSNDWDENWDARTHRTATGWTAELALPLRVLRFPTADRQTWGMQARRYVSELQETDEWSYIPRAAAGEVSHYGKLTDLQGLSSKTPIELRPFVLGKIQHRQASSDIVAKGTDGSVSAGIDLKWHPTQDLTLDATVNPDFAQVEADQLLLNLSTFETYYPEKRPFFLEGFDTFATPIQVVYTRRIGRAAASPTLRTDPPFGERLYDAPAPATIYGAQKLVGRIADQWTVGTLSALTAESDVAVVAPDGSRVTRLVSPLTSFQVLRVKRDVGENAHVGAILTATSRFEPTSQSPYPRLADGSGFLCPNGTTVAAGARCFRDSYVTGVDARWRSPSGDYSAIAQVIGSFFHGGPPTAIADGTNIAPGDVGSGASFNVSRQGGSQWLWQLKYDYASRTLDYNNLGFMQRQDLHSGYGAVLFRTLEPWGPTLETRHALELFEKENLDGLNLGRRAQLSEFFQLASFWQIFHTFHVTPARFDDREFGDGTALQRAWSVGYGAFVGSDPRKSISFGVYGDYDRNQNGSYVESSADLTIKPLPQLDLTVSPNVIVTHGEPRYVAAGRNPGELELGRLSAKNLGATLRSTYTFAPRITLQAFAQLFLASGHYDDFSIFANEVPGRRQTVRLGDLRYGAPAPATNPDFEQPALNVNVVLRWEYLLGSTLFLVYTRAQVPNLALASGQIASLDLGAVRRAPATDLLLLKASFFTPL